MASPAVRGIGTAYCPIDYMKALPYAVWKIGKGKADVVSESFYVRGKFWQYPWELFYIWHTTLNSSKPLILVEYTQASDFVRQIRARYPKLQLAFPSQDKIPGAIIRFTPKDAVQPLHLGRAESSDDFAMLKGTCEMSHDDLPDDVDALKAQIHESLHPVDKSREKAKQQARDNRDMAAFVALRQLQQHLGLRENIPAECIIDHKMALDVSCHPPFQSHLQPILISVDVEAYEQSPSIITEIGISTLDTRDLTKPPLAYASNWREAIRARHFRISEYAHFRNSKFVSGCPEAFQHGKSEFIPLSEINRVVATCFRPPYSQSFSKNIRQAELSENDNEKRPIIFVGHNAQADVTYLRKLGYDITNLSNLVATVDTATFWSYLTKEWNSISLGNLCNELEVDPWSLHNAGNDAYYTMACLLAMCVCDAAGMSFVKQKEKRDDIAPVYVEEPARAGTSTSISATVQSAPDSAVQQVAKEIDLITFSDGE